MLPDDAKPVENEPAVDSSITNTSAAGTPAPSQSSGVNPGASPAANSNPTGKPQGHLNDNPTLVMPEGPPESDSNSTIQLLQFPAKKFAVEIHEPPRAKGFWPECRSFLASLGKDYGAMITGLASVFVTLVIAYYANKINERQATSVDAQARAQQEAVQVSFIQEFRKHLGELALPEGEESAENLKERKLAAITLAQYGARALPALKMSLSVDDAEIREAAAIVIAQMLADQTIRNKVLTDLSSYFDENNSTLRIGVLECYLTIDHELTNEESESVKTKIKEHVNPNADYRNKSDEQRVLLWATKVFSSWPSRDSKEFLLEVAKNSTCGDDPREGAINYLPTAVMEANDISDEERKASGQDVVYHLQALQPQVSERLKVNITEAIAKLQTQ